MRIRRVFKTMIMIGVMFLLTMSMNVFATNVQDISPYYDYTNSTTTDIYISSSGEASATGSLTGYQDITTKVTINLYLQQYANGSWKTVDSWSETFNKYRGSLQGESTVSKGYKYRVKASYYAYSGSKYENIVSYSEEVKY